MRLGFFVGIVIVSVTLSWWLVLPLWILYAFRFRAYELIILGILMDAYFGYALSWHMLYTVVAVILCVSSELLKPRLAFYKTDS